MGPIQIFVLGFEDFQATGALATELELLSTAGTIRVIDARILTKDAGGGVEAVRISELDDAERAELRAAVGALIGLGSGAVLGDAATGVVVGAEAALEGGELGLTATELDQLAAELKPGQALLLLVIENVWAERLAGALRVAGVAYGRQDYLTPEGLVALGAALGLQVEAGA